MSAVRSIIIFNGGSAGDFLRIACLEQINGFKKYWLDDNGRTRYALEDNYLKELCKVEQRTKQHQTVDVTRCFEVEHAHSYHPWFLDLTTNLFYIQCNDSDILPVVETFIRKRSESDFDLWIEQTIPTHIPKQLSNKINQDNFSNVLSVFWKKNMHQWQSNSLLTPIPIRDLFEISALTKWVERVCGQPLSNPAQLANTHQAWLNKNSILLTSLT